MSNKFFLPIKRNALVLILMYFIGIVSILGMYLYDYENNICFYTFFSLIVVIINRVANPLHRQKEKVAKYMYITEILFVMYLFFVLFKEDNHFLQYKILTIPSILLTIIHPFGFRRVKK